MKQWHKLMVASLVLVALALALIPTLSASGGHDSLAVAAADIIYVDADATAGGNDGTSWGHAFTHLQAGISEAEAGEEVWVAEGVYKPTVAHGGTGDRFKSFQLKNGVVLYGGFDPSGGDAGFEDRDWANNVTILSGDLNGDDGPDLTRISDNSYHVFYHPSGTNLDSTAILDGFTVSGGNADADWSSYPHYLGGGMLNDGSSPALTNCTFSGNSTKLDGGGGGGMYNWAGSSPTLTNCTFSGNVASAGAGMANDGSSSPVLTHCTFTGNEADDKGGGMYNHLSSSPVLTDCTFSGNKGDNGGGGMHNDSSSPVLTDCVFRGNRVGDGAFGGGMFNDGSSPVLANCTFWGNSGDWAGGMFNDGSSPVLTNCTFWGNSAIDKGGAIYNSNSSSPTLTNCIVWGSSPDGIRNGYTSSASVTYSDIEDDYPGEGNIVEPPGFVSPGTGDFHVERGSKCVDAGYNDALELPARDFEGHARILDGDGDGTADVDMGVDEVLLRVYLPLVVRNAP